jgi:sulfhydrogenase subunit beta (sulfur reductase)
MKSDEHMMKNFNGNGHIFINHQDFQKLFDVLVNSGYQVIGPVLRDGAISYDQLNSIEDLPAGWTDEQEAGVYRIKKRDDEALFGYTVSPQSWKKFLHPPTVRLWQAKRVEKDFTISCTDEPIPQRAFIGVRACELNAIAIQDKVFMGGTYVDSTYASRRENIFIVAVNCMKAGNTCFCVSMNTGPKVQKGFDLY